MGFFLSVGACDPFVPEATVLVLRATRHPLTSATEQLESQELSTSDSVINPARADLTFSGKGLHHLTPFVYPIWFPDDLHSQQE